jgi:galactokinase
MIAIFQALAAANELDQTHGYAENIRAKEDLAAYLGCMENGSDFRRLSGDSGVGTAGGSEDHTAILLARAGALAQYGFCPTVLEREVRFPASHIFVIASSGVTASKTGEAKEGYNRASGAARRILEIWSAVSGRSDATLREALRSSADAPGEIRAALRGRGDAELSAEQLIGRFEQFLLESETVVPHGADAFARCDWNALDELSRASQESAENLLGNQVAETSALVRIAREHGAAAASAFGAGFGGSVWALVKKADAESFREGWRAEYRKNFPNAAPRSEFFLSGAGPGLMRLPAIKSKALEPLMNTDKH